MTPYDSDQNFLNSIKHGALPIIRKPLNMLAIQSSLIIALSNIKSEKANFCAKRVSVDYSNENIYLDDELVFLSQNNHKIFLWLFLYNLNNVVSYELIESYVYNDENFSKRLSSNVHKAYKITTC